MHYNQITEETVIEEIAGLAARGQWDEISKMVSEYPTAAVAVDRFGATALIRVAPFGGAANTIQHLISKGADPNHVDSSGVSALGAAISGGHKHGLTTDANVKALIDGGARTNVEAQNGFPPLHWALFERKIEIARALLVAGADPCAENTYGDDAFAVAHETGDEDVIAVVEKFERESAQ